MLGLPIVVNTGVVVRDTSLVIRIVELIGNVDQQGRIGADDLVSMADARRNDQLPRPQGPQVQRVARTVGRRIGPKVYQRDLKHSHHWLPAVGLVKMKVKGLDGSGIT